MAGVSFLELHVFFQNLNLMGNTATERVQIAIDYWKEKGGGITGEVDNAFREKLLPFQDSAKAETSTF